MTAGAGPCARLSEVCTGLGLPWVDASVDGSGRWLYGTVSAFDTQRPSSACYLCPLDENALDTISREGRGPGCPSWRSREAPISPPTLQSSAFAGGVIGGWQAAPDSALRSWEASRKEKEAAKAALEPAE